MHNNLDKMHNALMHYTNQKSIHLGNIKNGLIKRHWKPKNHTHFVNDHTQFVISAKLSLLTLFVVADFKFIIIYILFTKKNVTNKNTFYFLAFLKII